MKILVTAPNERPDFRQVLALLNFEHVDTDGDSHNPASRTWTWLHVQNRDEPYEEVDIYPKTESPLILTVDSEHDELAAAVAFYLATHMRGEVCINEKAGYVTPEALILMRGAFDLDAAILRAQSTPAARSTLEIPHPHLLMTTDEKELFIGRVHNLTTRFYLPPPLEEYLRSLWNQLQQDRNSAPSYQLFAMLIEKAFTEAPAPFDEKWKQYTAPGHVNSSSFDELEHTVLFQISDLHAMTENGQVKDRNAYLGRTSPSGNAWRTFDTCSFLSFAAFELAAVAPTDCNWGVFSQFLEFGRLSEL